MLRWKDDWKEQIEGESVEDSVNEKHNWWVLPLVGALCVIGVLALDMLAP